MALDKLISHIGANVEGLLQDHQGHVSQALDNLTQEEVLTISFTAKIKPLRAGANRVEVGISFVTEKIKANSGIVTVDEAQIPLPILEGMRDLCPEKGGSVSSITVSAGEESVTLTPETRDNLDRMIEREGR